MTPTPDFSQPVQADFVVALKAKNGGYDLFVEVLTTKNGKGYLRHTSSIQEARRFTQPIAENIALKVQDYRCTGRVELVSPDNQTRTVV